MSPSPRPKTASAPLGIVVDVLRATSTIAQALAAGYRRVLCCAEIEEARRLRTEIEGSLVGGERDARSDRGVRRRRLSARVPRAAGRRRHADHVDDERDADDPGRGRALRRGRARVAAEPRARSPRRRATRGDDVAILCAGFKGAFALDDAYCAGRIVALLGGRARRTRRSRPSSSPRRSPTPHGAARPHVRAARARGGHPVLLARERAAGRAAARGHGRARRPRSCAVRYRFAFGRPPAVAARAMVATSQPLATRAGLRALERGGNAADAALAAAAVLCVTEPMSTGIGGDCFAQVWRDGELVGLDSAGPAPALGRSGEPVEQTGPRSVTVPGAVAGWAAFAERFGRLGLDACLADAIDAAERGFAVAPRDGRGVGAARRAARAAAARRRASFVQPELGATLRRIAAEGPAAFYAGPVARGDRGGVVARGGRPRRRSSRAGSSRCASTTSGVEVCELPPPTQGVGALEALGLLTRSSPGSRARSACVAARARGRARARARRRRRLAS